MLNLVSLMKLGKTALGILKNTFIQSGGKVISVGLGFITVLLLTRYLGTAGYGNFTLVFSYLAFFSIISDFGMQLAIVKELSSYKGETKKIYGTYFLLKFALVIISSVIAIAILIFFPYSAALKFAIVIGALAVSISGMMGYFNAIFQAKLRLDLITLVDVVTKLVTVGLIAAFVLWRLNFYFIVSSILFGNLLGFLVAGYLLQETINFDFDYQLVKKIAILSIPIGITSFISTLYFKVDVIILSIYKSAVDVGIYSLAYKILENVILFWGFYMASTFPIMSKLRFKDMNEYNAILKKSIIIGLTCSIPLIIFLFYTAPTIISIFGGNKFYVAILPFRILLFSLPILFLNGILYNHYVIEKKNIITTIAMTIALISNIWLNIVYIPKFSYTAASYTTVISAAILLIGYVVGLKFHHRVREL